MEGTKSGVKDDGRRASGGVSRRTATVLLAFLLLTAVCASVLGFALTLRARAYDVRDDLHGALGCIMRQDADGAESATAKLEEDSAKLRSLLASPFGRVMAHIPGIRTEMDGVRRISSIVDEATVQVLRPYVDFMCERPLSGLRTAEGGFDIALINSYMDFFEEKSPYIIKLTDELGKVSLGSLDRSGKLESYRAKLSVVSGYCERVNRFIPVFRTFLGNGEDRTYLFAAQNSSEIRSSGGFPGAMGIVRISGGVLKIEEFRSVSSMLVTNTPSAAGVTPTENIIFSGRLEAPRDADFCPDFERVAGIWALSCRVDKGTHIDGVISATPALIQRALAILGPVTLSDGSVLDGENAVRVLGYELYYKYMSYGSNTALGNAVTDALFAETARCVVTAAVERFDVSDASKYLELIERSAADRTLALWFSDPAEQEAVRAAGLDCGLSRDPAAPKAGIYFSLSNPSRLGWFLDITPQLGEAELLEDGSRRYAVTLSFTNTMTQSELDSASYYIAGRYNKGFVTGNIYLFAPAGGSVELLGAGGGLVFEAAEYSGLELLYSTNIFLGPGETVSLSYTVTTAPGEQAPLEFSMTPTLSDYR